MSMLTVLVVRVAGSIAGMIVALALIKLWNKKPCWLRGHDKKHLSIEVRTWTSGTCKRPSHRYHGGYVTQFPCYITKWVCEKCDAMDYFCVGEAKDGAWTIEHGKVVPDEKAWAQWDKSNRLS